MPRMYFVVFIVVALSVYAAMHWFVFLRLANGLALTSVSRLVLKIALLAAALSFIVAESLGRLRLSGPLRLIGSLWLGVLAIALAFFVLESIASLLFPGSRRGLVIGALLIISLVSGFSIYNGQRNPRIKEYALPVHRLPPEAAGFTIVHLSDLHLGNLTPLRRLQWIVEQVNRLAPDLICVTGDVLDRDISQSDEFCRVLAGLKARQGVVAVTGNHEFYAGIDLYEKLSRACGWRILRNQSWNLDNGLTVVGLDDDAGKSFRFPGPNLDEALGGAGKGNPLILLYHRPDRFPKAVEKGIDLQLSGHTHAGQIPPMDFLVWLVYKYPAGLYRLGRSHIHTSAGTSTWGPPMRFLSSSEIVKLTLVPVADDSR